MIADSAMSVFKDLRKEKKKTQHLLPKFKIDIFSCVIVASVQNKVFQFWKLLSIHFKCRKEFKRWL